MSSTFASKTLPLSYTCCTLMPYSNGLMPILVRSTACDAVTFVPSVTTFTSAINSTAPLTILVGMLRVWKKFVDDGSKPVGPCGKKTSHIARVPAFAGAWRLFSVRMVRISSMSPWQNTKPQLPLMASTSLSRPSESDRHVLAQRRADHRVLAHQNGRLAAEGTADLLDLLGRNEIHRDHEDLRGLLDELDELLEVRGLLLLLHGFF